MEIGGFSAFTGSFYKAPISRALVYSSIGGYLFISYPAQKYLPLLMCNYDNLVGQKQLWRLPVSKLFFTDAKCVLLTVVLLFHFKKFEKRCGSRKFMGYLLGVFLITQIMELATLAGLHSRGIELESLPTGLLSVIISLFIPFFNDIPRVVRASIMGIPVSGKAMAYMCGLQIASSSLESLLLTGVGLVGGLLYRANLLWIKRWAVIPKFLSTLIGKVLSPVFDVAAPKIPNNYGATLELQRIEEEDRLEQAILMANMQHHRRQNNGQDGQAGLFAHLFRGQQGGNAGALPEPTAENIETLTNMGFTRDRVVEALRVCRNDINQATNHLLMAS